jgi:hypothetical protein
MVLTGLIGLLNGCKKDSPLPIQSETPPINTTDPDFIFFPTKNAMWIIKSNYSTPVGLFNFLDTLYLGKDTLLTSRTIHTHPDQTADADPPSIKSYKEIIITTMTISPTFDTTCSQPYRYGWFRQDVVAKKIYTPRFNTSDNMIYEDLECNFSLQVNDTTDFTPGWAAPLVVKSIDSIAFGNKYLKHMLIAPPSYTQPTGEIIQAVDIYGWNLNYGGSNHPGYCEWKKFIYKTDTMLMTY